MILQALLAFALVAMVCAFTKPFANPKLSAALGGVERLCIVAAVVSAVIWVVLKVF